MLVCPYVVNDLLLCSCMIWFFVMSVLWVPVLCHPHPSSSPFHLYQIMDPWKDEGSNTINKGLYCKSESAHSVDSEPWRSRFTVETNFNGYLPFGNIHRIGEWKLRKYVETTKDYTATASLNLLKYTTCTSDAPKQRIRVPGTINIRSSSVGKSLQQEKKTEKLLWTKRARNC